MLLLPNFACSIYDFILLLFRLRGHNFFRLLSILLVILRTRVDGLVAGLLEILELIDDIGFSLCLGFWNGVWILTLFLHRRKILFVLPLLFFFDLRSLLLALLVHRQASLIIPLQSHQLVIRDFSLQD